MGLRLRSRIKGRYSSPHSLQDYLYDKLGIGKGSVAIHHCLLDRIDSSLGHSQLNEELVKIWVLSSCTCYIDISEDGTSALLTSGESHLVLGKDTSQEAILKFLADRTLNHYPPPIRGGRVPHAIYNLVAKIDDHIYQWRRENNIND